MAWRAARRPLVAGVPPALQNAVEDLKAEASEVAQGFGGFGVAKFLKERVA